MGPCHHHRDLANPLKNCLQKWEKSRVVLSSLENNFDLQKKLDYMHQMHSKSPESILYNSFRSKSQDLSKRLLYFHFCFDHFVYKIILVLTIKKTNSRFNQQNNFECLVTNLIQKLTVTANHGNIEHFHLSPENSL